MKQNVFFLILTSIVFVASCKSQSNNNSKDTKDSVIIVKGGNVKSIANQTIAKYPNVKSIPTPDGYKRVELTKNSFGDFLRNLELKTENNIVYLYNGEKKYNQEAQFAVLKVDVGNRNLQQCADAVMRLRAEYLYSQKKYSDIHFNFLSDGKPRYFNNYAKGNLSHKNFRKYMNYIFSYANTASLNDELHKVSSISDIQVGDVFIQKTVPYGHAITVMDVAINEKGEKVFMLSQSYMPAQDIHILVNLKNKKISPWYKIKSSKELYTPEWDFTYDDLRRF